MRTRDQYKIKLVNVSDIKPEIVALSQEKRLKQSLFFESDEPIQRDEVKLIEVNSDYKYQVVNGRRRIETIRQENESDQVRAIIVPYVGESEFRIDALIANSGTPNFADEAEHIAYLIEHGHTQEEIRDITGLSIGTVNGRLRLIKKLIPEIFLTLKDGSINFSCAWECTKLSKSEQEELLQHIDNEGKKLQSKLVKEFLREKQAEKINSQPTLFDLLPEEENIPTGLFITYDQFMEAEKLPVYVKFMGKEFQLVSKNLLASRYESHIND